MFPSPATTTSLRVAASIARSIARPRRKARLCLPRCCLTKSIMLASASRWLRRLLANQRGHGGRPDDQFARWQVQPPVPAGGRRQRRSERRIQSWRQSRVDLNVQDWTGFVGQWDDRIWKSAEEPIATARRPALREPPRVRLNEYGEMVWHSSGLHQARGHRMVCFASSRFRRTQRAVRLFLFVRVRDRYPGRREDAHAAAQSQRPHSGGNSRQSSHIELGQPSRYTTPWKRRRKAVGDRQ